METEIKVEGRKKANIEKYITLAGKGDAVNQCKLGLCYKNGENVDKNLEKAFFWFQQSAKQGNAEGMKNLADCYENGEGVERDSAKAYELYKESATRGNVDALCELIQPLYDSDDGYGKAIQYAKYGATKGNKKAQYMLAYFYEKSNLLKKDLDQTFYWYEKSAKQGYAPAQVELGDCFAQAKGTVKDLKKAFYWYKKSATNGDKYGMNKLAEFYEKGITQKQSLRMAEFLHIKSAKTGDDFFLIELIEFYARNIETFAHQRSFHSNILCWVNTGIEQKFSCAQFLLARMFEKGLIVEQSFKKAFALYKSMKYNNHEYYIKSQRSLAYCYLAGHGTKKDVYKGVEILETLIKKYGSKDVEFELALLYQKGQYVAKDLAKACEMLQILATKRHALASYCLALNYLKGNGVAKSIERGNFWLNESAKLGCEKAKEKLEKLKNKRE